MFAYQVNPLTETVTQIVDATGVASYLIAGRDRAVLADTGTGIGSLLDAVKAISSLPLMVILTHGHGDHIGGAALFDDVRLSEKDWPLAMEHGGLDLRMGYARMSMPPETILSADDFVPEKSGGYKPLNDGEIFDLGGETIEIIAVPGHTKGTMVCLLREGRSLIMGDACNVNTLLLSEHSSTIGEYLESLKRLNARAGEFDTAYSMHGPAVQSMDCLKDNIELCRRILAGADDKVPCDFMGQSAFRAAANDESYRRLDGKFGNIVYDESKRR